VLVPIEMIVTYRRLEAAGRLAGLASETVLLLTCEREKKARFDIPAGSVEAFGMKYFADFRFDLGWFTNSREKLIRGKADKLAAIEAAVFLQNFKTRPEGEDGIANPCILNELFVLAGFDARLESDLHCLAGVRD
jgi:hypothetical protein